jgi:hypothetical protein
MNIRRVLNLVLHLSVIALCTLPFFGCATQRSKSEAGQSARIKLLSGTFGTYDAEPRFPNHRVDTDRLVSELVKVKANTYNFLIHHRPTDWDDLQLFLPKARANHIKVWVTLVPPSEPPFAEPFQLDFLRWGIELAKLSLQEPSLVAWSIDDFSYDAKIFTEEYIAKMVEDSHAINPQLAFVPCLYFKQMKPALVEKYRPYVDGILFPYRHEMGQRNLTDWDTLEKEIAVFRQDFGPSVPVFVDVYATKHSQLNDSSPEYVQQVMTISRHFADGVLIFCHQYEDKSPEKYRVIKSLFEQWAAEKKSK